MTTKSPPTTPQRVCLIGPAGSGKTTHARLLQAAWRGDVLSFATPLKKICRDLFGELVDDPVHSRAIHQKLGVAVREVDSQTWVRLLINKVSPDRNCFVDDARFYNEYVALAYLGFRFLRLTASDPVLKDRRPQMTAEERYHQSEMENLWIPTEVTFRTDDDAPEVVNQRIRHYLTDATSAKGNSDVLTTERATLKPAGE